MLLRTEGGELLLATDDPFSAEQAAWASERIRAPFAWRLVHRGDFVAYLASEETLRALDAVSAEAGAAGDEDRDRGGPRSEAIADEKSEVVRLVRSTLRDALKIGASDIHLETVAAGLVIKFRIDGILIPIKQIEDRAQAEQAIARVKVLAELDVTERRVPQDGRFKALDRGRAIDFRVSIMPSIHGEDAVLRVLDKQSLYESTRQTLSLDSLGFEERDIKALRRLSHEPHGMLLVTGPTGSGKTDALRRDQRDQQGPGQDRHHRGPGRVPASGRAADPGEREERPHLRARPALDPAPRPRPHHGGRDPRPGDRQHRGAVRAHRPPRLYHGARTTCST